MAIIYSYPQINLSSISADDLMIISDMNADGRPTKSLTLKNLADFVTSTGTGTGTTNKIIKWSDGPAGLLGDSIMTENATQIDLAGTFLSTSSPTATSGPVHAIRADQSTTTGGAFNIALYGDTKHTGATQANSNYGIYTKAEFEGTGGYTGIILGGTFEGRYDGSGTNGANASLYGTFSKANVTGASSGDIQYMIGSNVTSEMSSGTTTDVEFLQGQHTNVTLNSGNVSGDIAVNILDFDYTAGTLQGDFAYLQIQNDPVPTPSSGTARAINSDSTLPSHFSGQVEVPLIPTSNPHATSKQYVDTQIASIPAGLVFKGNWDANANSPTLASGTGTVGNYYVVSVAGNTNLDGITDWEVGDWAVFVEVGGVDKWDKIDQTFVQGSGVSGNMTYWNGINSVTYDASTPFVYSEVGGGGQPPGRLGLGTSSPNFKMDISGGDLRFENNDGIRFGGTGSANTNWRIYTTGSNSGTWKLAGGSDFVTVDRSATSAAATHGKVTFNKYGSGNFTGTAVYNLSVDANGVIVETTGGGAGGPYVPYMSGSDQIARTEGASTYNTSLGFQAAQDLTTGELNVLIGPFAGHALTTGGRNVAMGYNALSVEDTGNRSVAIGYAALKDQNYNGAAYNTAVGYAAGKDIINAINNTLIGGLAGDALTTGSDNVAIGSSALTSQLTGNSNVAIGKSAMTQGLATDRNVAIGYFALNSLNYTGDSYNVAVGYNAGLSVTTGTTNTLIGGLAGDALTTGVGNIAIGYESLSAETGSNSSVAIGKEALKNQNIGSGGAYNVAIGDGAGKEITSALYNTLVGGQAGDAITTGSQNTAVGTFTLSANQEGKKNVAIGYGSLNAMNPSSALDTFNVAIGYHSGLSVTTGVQNTLIGGLAGDSLTTANNNIAIGYLALTTETSGGNNVAIGVTALQQSNGGTYNVAIGRDAGQQITTGSTNTLIGAEAGDAITTGANNVVIGYDAADVLLDGVQNTLVGDQVAGALTSGDENTYIGRRAASSATTGNQNVAIGAGVSLSSATVSNEVNISNSSVIARFQGAASSWSFVSDARDKKDIEDLELGVEFINKLKPRKFKWDLRDSDVDKDKEASGFVAQEIKEVLDKTGVDYTGIVDTNNPDQYTVAQANIIPILVKAVQELSAEVKELKSKI